LNYLSEDAQALLKLENLKLETACQVTEAGMNFELLENSDHSSK
jgi:hypothetical protein